MADQPVVVVIDDSPTIRKIMELTLQRMDLRVVSAASGVAGLAAVAEHNPVLIFLDIVLPSVNGYQLCQVIKRNPRYQHIPVIMLSGKDGIFDKMRGRLAGASIAWYISSLRGTSPKGTMRTPRGGHPWCGHGAKSVIPCGASWWHWLLRIERAGPSGPWSAASRFPWGAWCWAGVTQRSPSSPS